jgi:hypothetical protein
MKKRYCFIVTYLLFIIVLSIFIYKGLGGQKKTGEIYSSLYNTLKYNSDIIKANMNEITDNNWSKLKKTNLEDEKLKNTYSLLVSDIKTCYLLSNDLKNETYDNIKILSFKNKTSVTSEEVSKLNRNKNCLENFDKYDSLVLSNDQKLSERMKTQIGIIVDYKPEPSEYNDFYDLLSEESITMSKVASLTNWLKIEYYSHKNN